VQKLQMAAVTEKKNNDKETSEGENEISKEIQ
jgi:hypothetical protein